jgi:hypothetical protein
MKHHAVLGSLALVALGSVATAAVVNRSTTAMAAPVHAVHAMAAQAASDAPLTRDVIIKEGPTALDQNCTKCHGSDKWEGTSRDHEGWAAIVATMQAQMAQAKMPPMSDRTTNLIVDYLTLAHPQ